MKTDAEFVNTLEDNIRERGAMDKLVFNRAQAKTFNKVKNILCHYEIKDWQLLPHFEHQNPVEQRYQTVKTYVNKILDRTNAPAYTWMLCLTYVCGLLAILACNAIGGEIPLTMLTGATQDISPWTKFYFWKEVYYATGDSLDYAASTQFPSNSSEGKGNFVWSLMLYRRHHDLQDPNPGHKETSLPIASPLCQGRPSQEPPC